MAVAIGRLALSWAGILSRYINKCFELSNSLRMPAIPGHDFYLHALKFFAPGFLLRNFTEKKMIQVVDWESSVVM